MSRKFIPQHGGGLFGEPQPETKPVAPETWRANIDGGSRGNPGPAGYGVVIRDPRGEIVARLKKYIGRTTNNVAEYYGLIAALDYAQSNNVRSLHIESDSELLVKQMRGQYKVKSADLQPLFERAKKMSRAFTSFRLNHVYREQNREADALANQAMDEGSGLSRAESEKAKTGEDDSAAAPAKYLHGKPLKAKDFQDEQSYRRDQRPIQARFLNGVFRPLERINLPDGTEVELLIQPRRTD
jgi:ribonuclease HI